MPQIPWFLTKAPTERKIIAQGATLGENDLLSIGPTASLFIWKTFPGPESSIHRFTPSQRRKKQILEDPG